MVVIIPSLHNPHGSTVTFLQSLNVIPQKFTITATNTVERGILIL